MEKINFSKPLIIPTVRVKINLDNPIQQSRSSDVFEKSQSNEIFTDHMFENAKKIVMRSILNDNPKESLVVVMNNNIIRYELGNNNNIELSLESELLFKNSNNKIAIIHSHPDIEGQKCATPVSFEDFENLNCYKGIKSVYAINSNGEYSMLEKTDNTVLSKEKISKYKNIFNNTLIEALDGKDKDIMKKYIKYAYDEKQKENKKLEEEYDEIYRHKDTAYAIVRATHEFWKKYSPELGLKYITNYSYL